MIIIDRKTKITKYLRKINRTKEVQCKATEQIPMKERKIFQIDMFKEIWKDTTAKDKVDWSENKVRRKQREKGFEIKIFEKQKIQQMGLKSADERLWGLPRYPSSCQPSCKYGKMVTTGLLLFSGWLSSM